MHQLLENSDETFVLDNEALFNISHNVLKLKEPRYTDLNWVISMVMSGVTASLRFAGESRKERMVKKLYTDSFPEKSDDHTISLFCIGEEELACTLPQIHGTNHCASKLKPTQIIHDCTTSKANEHSQLSSQNMSTSQSNIKEDISYKKDTDNKQSFQSEITESDEIELIESECSESESMFAAEQNQNSPSIPQKYHIQINDTNYF